MKNVNTNNGKYWYNITDKVKSMVGSDVQKVSVLLHLPADEKVGPDDIRAEVERIDRELANSSSDISIGCTCDEMQFEFADGRTVTLQSHT